MRSCRSGCAAHPRSRGENQGRFSPNELQSGSSPLTRGKLIDLDRQVGRGRLIPAHAGKTSAPSGSACASAAHPRSRGENSLILTGRLGGAGSSPLTRGKPVRRPAAPAPRRLIPAHAGKTRPSLRHPPGKTAHPRSRGENLRRSRTVRSISGSSPLTRGKQWYHWYQEGLSGLIPAHAGKTSDCSGDRLCVRAHPRSRGENVVRPGATILEPGSSPLTRGKRRRPYRRRQPDRLIPAHAGKTCCSTMWGRNFPAHPRSRGENLAPRSPRADAAGSSPLTRGKRSQ